MEALYYLLMAIYLILAANSDQFHKIHKFLYLLSTVMVVLAVLCIIT